MKENIAPLRAMPTYTIHLEELADLKDRSILDGEELARNARVEFKLEEREQSDGEIQINMPDSVRYMTLPFFEEMFGPSVEKLGGLDGFFNKYKFDVDSRLFEQIYDRVKILSPETHDTDSPL